MREKSEYVFMSLESRMEEGREAPNSTEGQSRFANLPQKSESVTQVIGDRYMDPDQLKRLLDRTFPGNHKMQVSETIHLLLYPARMMLIRV
jgi:hypothetical protein